MRRTLAQGLDLGADASVLQFGELVQRTEPVGVDGRDFPAQRPRRHARVVARHAASRRIERLAQRMVVGVDLVDQGLLLARLCRGDEPARDGAIGADVDVDLLHVRLGILDVVHEAQALRQAILALQQLTHAADVGLTRGGQFDQAQQPLARVARAGHGQPRPGHHQQQDERETQHEAVPDAQVTEEGLHRMSRGLHEHDARRRSGGNAGATSYGYRRGRGALEARLRAIPARATYLMICGPVQDGRSGWLASAGHKDKRPRL